MVVEGEFEITVVGACVVASLKTPRKRIYIFGISRKFFCPKSFTILIKDCINIDIISKVILPASIN